MALAQVEGFAPLAGYVDPPNKVAPAMDAEAETLLAEAQEHLDLAAELIEQTGYHRRDEARDELADVLAGKRKFADLPLRV